MCNKTKFNIINIFLLLVFGVRCVCVRDCEYTHMRCMRMCVCFDFYILNLFCIQVVANESVRLIAPETTWFLSSIFITHSIGAIVFIACLHESYVNCKKNRYVHCNVSASSNEHTVKIFKIMYTCNKQVHELLTFIYWFTYCVQLWHYLLQLKMLKPKSIFVLNKLSPNLDRIAKNNHTFVHLCVSFPQ